MSAADIFTNLAFLWRPSPQQRAKEARQAWIKAKADRDAVRHDTRRLHYAQKALTDRLHQCLRVGA